MAAAFNFDPDSVARAEAAGWKAYYDHDWLKLLRLVVQLCQAQFRIPFPMSLVAAYYITRASAMWVAVDHDREQVRELHVKFYRIAQRYSGLRFDIERVAELEEQYWEVHRRLSGQPDKTEFIETMVDLHSETFGISKAAARESAELRVAANTKVDLIISKTTNDPAAEWLRLEEDLRQCYRSIKTAMAQQSYP